MTTSDQIDQLATALAAAQGEIENAAKDTANTYFKSKYAPLSSVWDACRAALSKYGLAVIQSPTTAVGDNGAVEVTVETRLVHRSGQWVKSALSVWVQKADAQATGSAVTYLRRYSLSAFVGVAPADDQDDDAEAAVGRGVATAATTPTVTPDGYVEWLDELRKTAPQGTPALQTKWKASKVEFRDHLLRVAPKHWEAMKETASKVTAGPTPVVS